VDGIPFHPYYTVKDTLGAVVFLFAFCVIMFFIPELGGYFLEYNNFIPADPLKTPPQIAPLWYFTPYYSILRAVTEEFVIWLALGVFAYTLLILFTVRSRLVKLIALVAGLVVILLMAGPAFEFTLGSTVVVLPFVAKVWGVVLMGVATLIFVLLPWLDRSPVKSIRYKGALTKWALGSFLVAFFILGYLGTLTVTEGRTLLAQIFTFVYFAYFLLMPWYTTMEKTRPEPARVTM
jgi:ubiquinol-cytochrome c reductase cytochrome b subunit